jgi:hypothetical protein
MGGGAAKATNSHSARLITLYSGKISARHPGKAALIQFVVIRVADRLTCEAGRNC